VKLPAFQIADGSELALGERGVASLTVATDEDWLECCEMARRNISNGGAVVPEGQTWEQAIAHVGARLLGAGLPGTAFPACGRTPDEAEWAKQSERWIAIVHDVAARGSAHSALEPGSSPPVFVLTGTVHTHRGRVPLADVEREER
jgi:hypothetical protein